MDIAKLLISIAAVDNVSKVFSGITNAVKKTKTEVVGLWKEGKKLDATMKTLGGLAKGAGVLGVGVAAIAGPAVVSNFINAQEGFTKIAIRTRKSAKEMEAVKSELYDIATRNGRSVEEILSAAYGKFGEGMKDADVFATLRQESMYAAASYTNDVGVITKATQNMARHMKMDTATASGALALTPETRSLTGPGPRVLALLTALCRGRCMEMASRMAIQAATMLRPASRAQSAIITIAAQPHQSSLKARMR